MSGSSILLAVASLLAIGVAYGPLMVAFGQDLWGKAHYQHFPFVLLAAALLFTYRLRASRSTEEPRPVSWLPYTAYAVAWLLLCLAHYLPSPLFAAVSLVILLGGWGLSFARQTGAAFPVGPWMLLWLVIPPPLGMDGHLMTFLQHNSSRLSSYALDLLGINHLMDGNALVLQDKQLFVDEACSGIISVISIVSCAAMYGVWRRRTATHTILMMVLAAGWASLLNVVRIGSIALAWVRAGIDWSEGISHTALGLAIFAASLLLLVATDWFLKAALAEIAPRWDKLTSEPIGIGAGLVSLWDWLGSPNEEEPGPQARVSPIWAKGLAAASIGLAPTLAFAGLGASQFLLPTEALLGGSMISPERFATDLQQDLLPAALDDLTLISTEYESRTATSVFGQHSVVYEYADQHGLRYLVSCDFLFTGGWHELATCYTGIGWRVDAREVFSSTPDSGIEPYEYAQMDLTKPDGRLALVTYTACTVDGGHIRPTRFNLADRLLNAFRRRSKSSGIRQSFQAQVLVEQSTGLNEANRETSRRLLEVAEKRFVKSVLAQPRS